VACAVEAPPARVPRDRLNPWLYRTATRSRRRCISPTSGSRRHTTGFLNLVVARIPCVYQPERNMRDNGRSSRSSMASRCPPSAPPVSEFRRLRPRPRSGTRRCSSRTKRHGQEAFPRRAASLDRQGSRSETSGGRAVLAQRGAGSACTTGFKERCSTVRLSRHDAVGRKVGRREDQMPLVRCER
jgi:hypothetical protein